MQYHEQIYTSAAKLLENSSGNLGVVAKTRDFPKGVENQTTAHRAFTPLLDLPLEQQPPNFIVELPSSTDRFLLVSRVVPAGADHTGRTTPLAHHMVFDWRADSRGAYQIEQLLAAVRPLFLDRWTEAPRWIEPPSQVEFDGADPFPSNDLGVPPAILFAVADAIFQYRETRKPVVFCIPSAQTNGAFLLLCDIIGLVPQSSDGPMVFQTHVVSRGDWLRDAVFGVTYRDSDFLKHCLDRQDDRQPWIIDIEDLDPDPPKSTYASLLADAWSGGGQKQLYECVKQIERSGISAGGLTSFIKCHELAADLSRGDADVQRVAEQFGVCAEQPRVHEFLTRAACDYVDSLLESEKAEKWITLQAILEDGRWPDAARTNILTAVGNPIQLRQLVSQDDSRDLVRNPSVVAEVRSAIEGNQDLVSTAIANSTSSVVDHQLADYLLDISRPNIDTALAWRELVLACPANRRQSLLTRISRGLQSSIANLVSLDRVCSWALAHPSDTELRDAICLPLLRNQAKIIDDRETWLRMAGWHVQLALCSGTASSELSGLLALRPEWLKTGVLARWLELLTTDQSRNDLLLAMRSAGMELPPSASMVISDDLPGLQPPEPKPPPVARQTPQPNSGQGEQRNRPRLSWNSTWIAVGPIKILRILALLSGVLSVYLGAVALLPGNSASRILPRSVLLTVCILALTSIIIYTVVESAVDSSKQAKFGALSAFRWSMLVWFAAIFLGMVAIVATILPR